MRKFLELIMGLFVCFPLILWLINGYNWVIWYVWT